MFTILLSPPKAFFSLFTPVEGDIAKNVPFYSFKLEVKNITGLSYGVEPEVVRP